MSKLLPLIALLGVVCCQSFATEPLQQVATSSVDASTLTGKVMCGYQGWFNCQGDGAQLGWTHWARNPRRPFGPGNVTVDLWPDVSEYNPAELYETGFRHADGSVAKVFSSANRDTVRRHFQWMREYGIDGAFVQRFANGLSSQRHREHKDNVLAAARKAAKLSGRVYAVMYDLSGLRAGDVNVVAEDWRRLRTSNKITDDASYLRHEGKPVVAVWGVGFSDDRKYSLAECRDLVNSLKADGCTVMLGVPSWWRELRRDAVDDPALHDILTQADIISPWTIGRYRTPKQAAQHAQTVWAQDLQWCAARKLDFLPVAFPGFSWHNLHGGKIDDIPRLRGQFLWSQIVAAKRAGCQMIYIAMFDEVDEGTAVFKCTNQPPVGDGLSFLTYEGLPSDHYLKLVGRAGKMLRGEIPVSDQLPSAD